MDDLGNRVIDRSIIKLITQLFDNIFDQSINHNREFIADQLRLWEREERTAVRFRKVVGNWLCVCVCVCVCVYACVRNCVYVCMCCVCVGVYSITTEDRNLNTHRLPRTAQTSEDGSVVNFFFMP